MSDFVPGVVGSLKLLKANIDLSIDRFWQKKGAQVDVGKMQEVEWRQWASRTFHGLD